MRSTHDRAILAARAEARLPGNPRPRPTTPGTNPGMRPITNVAGLRTVPRKGKRSKGRGPGTQARDSRGLRSDWTRSPYAPRGGWR